MKRFLCVGMEAEEQLVRQLGVPATLQTRVVDGVTIRFLRAGSGEPLVFLHGATIGWGQWFANIAFFAQSFSVYALDMPGAGGSTPIDFLTANMESSVVRVLAHFLQAEGVAHAAIVGHSWGGWVAVQLAMRSDVSVSRLLLISPVGFTAAVPWRYRMLASAPIVHLLARTVMRPVQKNMETFLQGVLASPHDMPPALSRLLSERIQAAPARHPFFLIHRMANFFSVRKEFLFEKNTTTLSCPVLVISGEKDPVIGRLPEASVLRIVPHAQVVQLAGVGHVPSIEQPEQFHEIASTFLHTYAYGSAL